MIIKKCTVLITIMVLAAAFTTAAIPSWVIDAGVKFLGDPGDVFYNWHLDNVDYTPVLADRHATLRTNFLPSLIPFTWANANLNIKLLSDTKYYNWMPQIDFSSSYGKIIALSLAEAMMSSGNDDDEADSSDDFTVPKMKEYSIGVTLTKAVSQETRLYAGFHYSVFDLKFTFPDDFTAGDDKQIDELIIKPLRDNGLNIKVSDYVLVTGITNIISSDKSNDRRMIAYLGYGFRNKKIFSRFSWHYDHLEVGFNIYPEGLLVVHPHLGWHWFF